MYKYMRRNMQPLCNSCRKLVDIMPKLHAVVCRCLLRKCAVRGAGNLFQNVDVFHLLINSTACSRGRQTERQPYRKADFLVGITCLVVLWVISCAMIRSIAIRCYVGYVHVAWTVSDTSQ